MTEFCGRALACRRGERLVFRGLDFAVASGGILVLIGPNGSGKSSLLRVMAGLDRPASGSLNRDGVDVDAEPDNHRQRLHYLGHLDAVKPALSVAETLRFWACLQGSAVHIEDRIDRALAAFGIARLAHVPGRYLSAGQRRRLALARLVATPLPLWLLDEPKTSLDTDAAAMLDEVVAAHRRDGGIVVIAMHDGRLPDGAIIVDLARFAESRGRGPC
jgi:heme exporter protein A